MNYYEIAPTIPLHGNRQTYTYRSKESVAVGVVVRVPFGKRTLTGIVVSKASKPPYPTKDISKTYTSTLTHSQLAFGARIAGMCGGGLGFTLKLFLPPNLNKSVKGKKTAPQSLIIVPEKWMMADFPDATAYHAGLSKKEQETVWNSVLSGEKISIVATQKGLFLPWQHLESVTIHEAQLSTHKLWDQYPRLDNRRFGMILADQHKANYIENASFPSLELWNSKKSTKVNTELRYTVMPFSIEDRRNKFLLPDELIRNLYEWTRKQKEQVLILHNKADSTIAKSLKSLRLSRKFITYGTVGVFTQVQNTKFDRVIWLYPEQTFTFPDFQSREHGVLLVTRLQSLLKKGRSVVLATRHAEYLERMLNADASTVYEEVLKERKKYQYPPFTDIARLTFLEKAGKNPEKRADVAYSVLTKKPLKNIRVLGPYPTLKAYKKSDKPKEWHILLLGPEKDLTKVINSARADISEFDPQSVLT